MRELNKPLEQGMLFKPTIADPTIGTNLLYVLPNNKTYQLIGVQFKFTSSGTATNRGVQLKLNDIAGNLLTLPNSQLQAASTGMTYIYYIGANTSPIIPGFFLITPLPECLYIKGNGNITTNILNIQAGDAITNIQMLFNTWIERTV